MIQIMVSIEPHTCKICVILTKWYETVKEGNKYNTNVSTLPTNY